ncbi:MAG: hypothetical protein Q9157_002047 [Trypethelium eluteriae]
MPEVAFSFTIPSLHDDAVLDCRVYLPSSRIRAEHASRSDILGAVMTHPYAPVGGCYDDPVVLGAVEELLRQGVYGGNGRTSWTGKPEIQDYISFAGFFAHYLDLVQQAIPSNPSMPVTPSQLHPESAVDPKLQSAQDLRPPFKLILGGYSYGSVIVTRLPPLRDMLSGFRHPEDGTAASEILQRARTISSWTIEKVEAARRANARRLTPSITMGGEETPSDQRRVSREGGGHSLDLEGLRRSLDIPRRIKEHRSHTRSREHTPSSTEKSDHDDEDMPSIKVQYLLVSPVLGIVGSALSAFGAHGDPADVKTTLAKEPTLAVYGDKDIFTSTRKVRQWAQRLSSNSDRFWAVEVNGAGHFWRERGVTAKLRSAIESWVTKLQAASR